MAQVHMKQTGVVKDFDAVITQVRRGAEIVVEANDQPLAVIRAPERPGGLWMTA
jgi:hypothetical protein